MPDCAQKMQKFSNILLLGHHSAGGFQQILMASVMVVGARIVGGVIGLITQLFVARSLGAEALGNYFYSISLVIVLSVVGGLGYPSIVTRFVAGFKSFGDSPISLRQFSRQSRFDITVSTICFALLTLAAFLLLNDGISRRTLCLFIVLASAPIFTLGSLNTSLAIAHKKFALAYLPLLFFQPALILLSVFLMYWLLPDFNEVYLVASHCLIVNALIIYQQVRLNIVERDTRNTAQETSDRPDLLNANVKWILRRHALPMVIATLFVSSFSDLNLIILGSLLSESELAVFGTGLKIALFMAFAIQAIHQLVSRDLADTLKDVDIRKTNTVVKQANLLSVLCSFFALSAVILFGRQILLAFGTEFEQGYHSLIILMVAQVIRAIAGPGLQILTINSLERNGLPIFVGSFLFLLLANLVLVPIFHLEGAAISVLFVTAFWSLGLAIITFRKTGLNTICFVPFIRKH